MSFMLGGTEAPRPTFFELVAAERLMPSLKAAASYSLQASSLTFRPCVCGLKYFASLGSSESLAER